MIISGAMVLVLGPVAGAAVTWLLSRWPRLAVVTGTVLVWFLALWLWLLVNVEEPVFVFGHFLILTEGLQSLFGLVFSGLGLLFLLSLWRPEGQYFVPASLAALSPMMLALMIRPLALGALIFFIAVFFLGITIQSNRAGRTQGAWRFVVLMFLAVMLLSAGGWMADTGQPGLQEMAGQWLAVAFLILLAGFPFHIWLQPVLEIGRNLTLVWLLGLAQILSIGFIYEWLAAYPIVQTTTPFRLLIQWSSGLTALTAGALAMTMAAPRRLLGSLILLDMSVSLALLLVPVEIGGNTAVLLPLLRSFSLLMVILGREGLSSGTQPDQDWRGLARKRPAAALVFGFGLLSLLGLPLTAGFTGRWAAVLWVGREADVSFWLLAALLLAMGGGIYGVWHALSPLILPEETAAVEHQSTGLQIGLWLSLAAGILLAVTSIGLTIAQNLAGAWLSTG
jgi:formate hydrogenlyase subunit 3/multisubunit Na+/H+ antiporter MnhD subunit